MLLAAVHVAPGDRQPPFLTLPAEGGGVWGAAAAVEPPAALQMPTPAALTAHAPLQQSLVLPQPCLPVGRHWLVAAVGGDCITSKCMAHFSSKSSACQSRLKRASQHSSPGRATFVGKEVGGAVGVMRVSGWVVALEWGGEGGEGGAESKASVRAAAGVMAAGGAEAAAGRMWRRRRRLDATVLRLAGFGQTRDPERQPARIHSPTKSSYSPSVPASVPLRSIPPRHLREGAGHHRHCHEQQEDAKSEPQRLGRPAVRHGFSEGPEGSNSPIQCVKKDSDLQTEQSRGCKPTCASGAAAAGGTRAARLSDDTTMSIIIASSTITTLLHPHHFIRSQPPAAAPAG